MRFTLRVWRSRFANNEKLRNRDRRYPGKWDAIVLSNREMEEREKLRRLHARSQVDDVGELDPYEESDEEIEVPVLEEDAEAANGDANGEPTGSQEAQTARADAVADTEADGADEARASDDEAGGKDNDDDEEDEDDGSDDEDDDEDGTVDGDEELAALRAEAGEAGEDLDQDVEGGGRRSRGRRSAAAVLVKALRTSSVLRMLLRLPWTRTTNESFDAHTIAITFTFTLVAQVCVSLLRFLISCVI